MGYQILLKISSFIFIVILFTSSSVQASEVLNESVSIGIISFKAYSVNLNAEATVDISIQVTNGNDVTLIFLSEANYNIWTSGESAQARIYRQDIVQGSYTNYVSQPGRYYLVLDNMDSLFSGITVKVIMEVTYPVIDSGRDLFIGIILMGVTIIGIFIYFTNKNKKQSVRQYQPQGNTSLVCKTCSVTYPRGTKYCIECGSNLT